MTIDIEREDAELIRWSLVNVANQQSVSWPIRSQYLMRIASEFEDAILEDDEHESEAE